MKSIVEMELTVVNKIIHMLVFIFLITISYSYANTVCDDIDTVINIEKSLQKFERVNGAFIYTGKLMEVSNLNGNLIKIPEFSYDEVRQVNYGGRSADIYEITSDEESGMTVMRFNYSQTREYTLKLVGNSIISSIETKPLFYFIKETLGIYEKGFCSDKDLSKTVSMFMASVAQPIRGLGNEKTKVYFVENLDSLLLVKENGPYVEFIYSDKNDINGLVYIQYFGGMERIMKNIKKMNNS